MTGEEVVLDIVLGFEALPHGAALGRNIPDNLLLLPRHGDMAPPHQTVLNFVLLPLVSERFLGMLLHDLLSREHPSLRQKLALVRDSGCCPSSGEL